MGLGEGWRLPRELRRAGSSCYCPDKWPLLSSTAAAAPAPDGEPLNKCPDEPSESVLLCPAAPPACLWPTPLANSLLLIPFPLTTLKRKPPLLMGTPPSIPWVSHTTSNTLPFLPWVTLRGAFHPYKYLAVVFSRKFPASHWMRLGAWGSVVINGSSAEQNLFSSVTR